METLIYRTILRPNHRRATDAIQATEGLGKLYRDALLSSSEWLPESYKKVDQKAPPLLIPRDELSQPGSLQSHVLQTGEPGQAASFPKPDTVQRRPEPDQNISCEASKSGIFSVNPVDPWEVALVFHW